MVDLASWSEYRGGRKESFHCIHKFCIINLLINRVRVTETFQANHGFTVMFLPGRNDSPVSEFTDIKEIFNLIRKYTKN